MVLDPVKAQVRRERKRQRLGTDAKCVFCREKNSFALNRYPWRILQEHHLFGQNNDPDSTVILCMNCHAKVTAAQWDAGADLQRKNLFIESLPEMFRSLKAMFLVVAEKLGEWADEIALFLSKLDKEYPGWRERF